MALRIACDLDGTLADMDTALQREAEKVFGPTVDIRLNRGAVRVRRIVKKTAPEGDGRGAVAVDRRPLTRPELQQLWKHVRDVENFWMTLGELEPGLVRRLAEIAEERGWELLFLTTRPATSGETVQVQTQRWLRAHGFEWPSVYVVNGSRGKVAAALELDAVVDDRPEHVADVAADSDARPILVWRDQSAPLPRPSPTVATVYSFAEALDLLSEMGGRSGVRGFMRRVRAAFGK